MKIEQKKLDTRISFEFQPDGVKYSIKDKNHSEPLTVPYEEISKNTSDFEERNQWFRNVAIYLGILGVIAAGYNIANGQYKLPIWLLIAGIFFIMYRTMRVQYTVIDCSNCRLFVIKDKYHEQVLKTLQAWRANHLQSTYGKIDPNNDPNAELRKFAWLKSEGAITDDEFERLKAQLTERF
ncbi:MAG: SHOCT domain-containing protein [Kiritimatiellae bacterium]|nr:SHOCT domain-containing protein [Kiritimatiellia bacterium]MCO5068294.1 SHOCT domain-containing protein [Kiritimatiellia bacterium]